MHDLQTLIAMLDFTRSRLLASLDAIEKSGADVRHVLAWRPGPARAHIAWQAMHCAATHDRYIHVRILGGQPNDPGLCEAYAGGSTPTDSNIPNMDTIKQTLAAHLQSFKAFLQTADLCKVTDFPNNIKRTTSESAILLAWHEAHHQGQIHLTWNLYRAQHGMS